MVRLKNPWFVTLLHYSAATVVATVSLVALLAPHEMAFANQAPTVQPKIFFGENNY
jgi:hypothetical protein